MGPFLFKNPSARSFELILSLHSAVTSYAKIKKSFHWFLTKLRNLIWDLFWTSFGPKISKQTFTKRLKDSLCSILSPYAAATKSPKKNNKKKQKQKQTKKTEKFHALTFNNTWQTLDHIISRNIICVNVKTLRCYIFCVLIIQKTSFWIHFRFPFARKHQNKILSKNNSFRPPSKIYFAVTSCKNKKTSTNWLAIKLEKLHFGPFWWPFWKPQSNIFSQNRAQNIFS